MLKGQNNCCRTQISLDGLWEYAKIGTPEGFNAEGLLAVPASWNEQIPELFHYKKAIWYQRTFEMVQPGAGKRVLLRFSGLLYQAQFYLNSEKIGEDLRGYLPSIFDITEKIKPGTNKLVVCVTGDIGSHQPVGSGDFYEFGGICRPVTLEIVPEKHFNSLRVEARADGSLSIRYHATGGTKAHFTVQNTVLASDGKEGSTQGQIPNITPWCCETPQLYELVAELFDDSGLCDCYKLPIGFRTIEVRGNKLFLNGKEFFLTGFSRHEDFYVLGKACNQALNVRDFELLRWIGANSIRTSHYPDSEELFEIADRLGIAVIDEMPFGAMSEEQFGDAELQARAVGTVEVLIERDYNHPCVISWSLGNECKSQLPESETFFAPLFEAARKADPARPLTYVAFTRPGEDHVYQFADIIGINRYFGWYGYPQWGTPVQPGDLNKSVQMLSEELDQFSKLYDKPMILTEFGADCIAGHHSFYVQHFTEEFQSEFLRRYIQTLQQRSDMAGMHVWCFADFLTQSHPLRVQGNRKGVFTRTREPKLAAYTVRELWTGKHGLGVSVLGDDNSNL